MHVLHNCVHACALHLRITHENFWKNSLLKKLDPTKFSHYNDNDLLTEVVSLLEVVEITAKEVLPVVVPEVSELPHAVQPTLHHAHKLLTHRLCKVSTRVVASWTVTHVLTSVESQVELNE